MALIANNAELSRPPKGDRFELLGLPERSKGEMASSPGSGAYPVKRLVGIIDRHPVSILKKRAPLIIVVH